MVGGQVQITCTTEEPDQYGVHWEFLRSGSNRQIAICSGNTVKLEVSEKYECMNNQTEHTLTIKSVVFSDDGTYTCTEDGGRGPDSDSSRLIVIASDSDTTTTSQRANSTVNDTTRLMANLYILIIISLCSIKRCHFLPCNAL